MQLPVHIVSRDLYLSRYLETTIHEKASKLDTFYGRITRCQVVIESQTHHHWKNPSYKVRIDLSVPGAELVVNHHENPDLKIAIRDAFEAAKRQLQSYARQQRGDVKAHSALAEAWH